MKSSGGISHWERQLMGIAKSSGKASDKFLPNPKLKLREQLAEVCRFRRMSHRTESAYWSWIRDFLRFHRQDGEGRRGADVLRPYPGRNLPSKL